MTSQFTTDQLQTLADGLRIIALRSLGDLGLASEAAQETMTRVLDAAREGRVRDPGRIAAFARAVLQHVIVDQRRAGRRLVELRPDIPNAESRNALDALVDDEQVLALNQALARLSSDDRELLRLSFVENLSPGDVAARLREPAQRIRKRKSRALQRLRDVFLAMRAGHEHRPPPTMRVERSRALSSLEAE